MTKMSFLFFRCIRFSNFEQNLSKTRSILLEFSFDKPFKGCHKFKSATLQNYRLTTLDAIEITPANEIGALFSIVAFAEILVTVCGSSFFSAIYPLLISWWPGFCFCIIAMVLFSGFCILIGLKFSGKLQFSTNQILVSVDEE